MIILIVITGLAITDSLSPRFKNCCITSSSSQYTFSNTLNLLSLNTTLFYTSGMLNLPIFSYNLPNNVHHKTFSLPQQFIQFRMSKAIRELGSLVRTDIFLISPFFLKVWIVITGLTITDSLSPRFKNCYIATSSRCLQPEWQII